MRHKTNYWVAVKLPIFAVWDSIGVDADGCRYGDKSIDSFPLNVSLSG